MSVVKIIELVGESPNGWEDAMRQVIEEAQKTLRGITRIGVVEQDVRLKAKAALDKMLKVPRDV